MSAVGGNYISDGALMAWLANQQDRIYGDLRESMDLSERRADLSSKLVDIKAHLEEARLSGNFAAVDQELQGFLAEFGSDPAFAEICDVLRPIADQVNADWGAAVRDYDARLETYYQDQRDLGNLVSVGGTVELTPEQQAALEKTLAGAASDEPEPPKTVYSEEQVKNWTNLIDGKLDTSSKNDQLTMIHIQELKATLDQSTQLASSLIAGGDKTTSSIINNLA